MGLFGLGWKGIDNEDDMSDDDWGDRARRTAVDMLNGVAAGDAVTDSDGDSTNGCYNDDYSASEHREANYRYEEDPDYAAEQDAGARVLNYLREEGFTD